MNKQNFKNSNNRFPVSTDTLNFMQEQTMLIQRLTALYGEMYILQQSSASIDGVICLKGELLPLKGDPDVDGEDTEIALVSVKEDITANGILYKDARETRYAIYCSGGDYSEGEVHYMAYSVPVATSISKLLAELTDAKRHHMPKGSIIDYYGEVNADALPYGWVPCGQFFTGSGSQFAPGAAGTLEIAKWKSIYPGIGITTKSIGTSGTLVGILISECNGQIVPDMTDRFALHAGGSYQLGIPDGEKEHKLLMSEMPEHSHAGSTGSNTHSHELMDVGQSKSGGGRSFSKSVNDNIGGNYPVETRTYTHSHTISPQGGGQAHNNMPPYYPLYKLIKVI